MMRKVLLTGGAGFLAYHLAKSIVAEESDTLVVLVDNLQRGEQDEDFDRLRLHPNVRFFRYDLTNPIIYREALGCGYDHVYHLAAVNGTKNFYLKPHEVLRTNTLITVYMLDWMAQKNFNGKFCFASSNEAYAGGLNAFGQLPIPTPENVPLVIEDTYNPRWSYASTKLIGECFTIHYAAKHGLRALIVRPHNLYGPRAGEDHVVPEFCRRIAKKVDPFPINGADDTRTFCYVEDCVRAMRMLMDSPKTDARPIETVQIGDTEEITIRELAAKMFVQAGWCPDVLDIKESPFGSVKRRLADSSKLRTLTGWEPRIKLDEGLRWTWEWYRDHPRRDDR